MIKRVTLLLLILIGFSPVTKAQQQSADKEKMEWFEDAKLGIFIHWGIYAVDGISESWAFFNNYISHSNYMKQLDGFSASSYNPEEWVDLIEKSGAQYSVITSRHHDGVSLWDSKAEKAITTKKDAAAQRDVLTPFIQALQKTELKTGIYYSLPDWSHPYYDIKTRSQKRYEIEEDPKRWDSFVTYYQTQLEEISQQFKPDLLWFDGDWEHSSEEWKTGETQDLLTRYNPNIIINSRLDGKGDYDTPEQGIPVVTPESDNWELCYTMNDSWGYQPFDRKYKSPNMIIRTLADVISMGGNLLLDIGPKEDGSIPEEQVEILENLGRWTSKHAEAIYKTKAGLPFENYQGKSALSKDDRKLFLYLEETKDFSKIYGLATTIKSAKIIGNDRGKVRINQSKNGNVLLEYENVDFDDDVSVVQLSFDSPIELKEIVEDQPALTEVLKNKNTKKAVYTIAQQLHNGNNLLAETGLQEDGEGFDLKNKQFNSKTVTWIKDQAEALFETGKGLPNGHYSGLSALSKDKQTLFLFVEGKPTGPIAIKGLKNDLSRIRIVGEGSIISHEIYNKLYWSEVPGIIYINIPEERLNEDMTVISILLDKPIELYRDKVGAVESNL